VRNVPAIAADDCVLFMWAIVPMLAEAFCVLDAWGFARFERNPSGILTLDKSVGRYVSSAAWLKYKPGAGIGMGHWFRVDHEILLVATRGSVPCPAQGEQSRSVFDVPASRVHSQKPELVLELIEKHFPNLPKIELNRRGPPRPGWDAWGNEVEIAPPLAPDPLDIPARLDRRAP
jgi:N6-adenosine-specific RNA methylase IME4